MIKTIALTFLFIITIFLSNAFSEDSAATIYIVRYAGYSWSPCTLDPDTGLGICLDINCSVLGCKTPAETIICKTLDCAKEVVKRRGRDHLTGIYQVTFEYYGEPHPIVKKMSVVESYDIIESQHPLTP